MEFQEASLYLSLFYRNSKGHPQLVRQDQLPVYKNQKLHGITNSKALFERVLQANLELKKLLSREKQAPVRYTFGTKPMAPGTQPQLRMEQRSPTRLPPSFPQENRVLLNLAIPFQYRKAQGRERAGKARLKRVKVKTQWTREKIQVQAQTLITKINALVNIFEMTSKQVKLSEKLAQAERKKFRRGASDLILLNFREEMLAEAQIKNLSFLLKYHLVDTDLKNLQVELLPGQSPATK